MTVPIDAAGTTAKGVSGRSRDRGVPVLALVPLAAVVWWLAGFAWWIVQLFGSNILTVNGYPRAALPLLAASSTDGLIVSCVVGGVLAGLLGLVGRGGRVGRLVAVAAGVGIALAVTVSQSRSAFAAGGVDGQTTDVRVTGGLSLLVVVVSAVAVLLGASSLAGRPGLGLALAVASGALPIWLVEVMSSVSGTQASSGSVAVVARWAGAAMLTAALVAIGMRPVARLVWWPLTVLVAWLMAPSVTASGYFAMSLSRGPRTPASVQEYVSAAAQVWRQAVEPGQRPLAPWFAAIVVAAVLAWLLDRRRQPDDDPHPDVGAPPLVVAPAEPPRSDRSGAVWP